jgi:hypothetical protein
MMIVIDMMGDGEEDDAEELLAGEKLARENEETKIKEENEKQRAWEEYLRYAPQPQIVPVTST